MNPFLRRLVFIGVPILLAGGLLFVMLALRIDHAYTSGIVNEDIYDVNVNSGAVTTIPFTPGSAIVGMAYWSAEDRLYARIAPGNRIVEIERATGATRDIIARDVPVGCGVIPEIFCGLTLRERDGNLFLDSPVLANGEIFEIDQSGGTVRRFTLQRAVASAVGGLGYHQRDDRLWVLFRVNRLIAEYDLSGGQLRTVSIAQLFQPNSLAIDSGRNQLLVPNLAGDALEAYDFQGNRLRDFPIQRAVAGFLGGGTAFGNR